MLNAPLIAIMRKIFNFKLNPLSMGETNRRLDYRKSLVIMLSDDPQYAC